MITLGIDLASQPARTAVCVIRWSDGRVEVEPPCQPADDALLLDLIERADRVGVDVPLGWPRAFGRTLAAHVARRTSPAAALKHLTHRATDHFVHSQTGRWPLSVSTDRIGVPALRAARLFGQLDRSGAGRLVEVYPAAALRLWGLPSRGYKGRKGRETLERLIEELGARSWLSLDRSWLAGDHALDALVCALVARAAAQGLCQPIPAGLHGLAAEEGWIALPQRDSLDQLA